MIDCNSSPLVRRLLALLFVAAALAPGLQARQQPIEFSLNAFGGQLDDTNPGFPTYTFFVGQPAVFVATITNNLTSEQTVQVGGGGGLLFQLESITVEPESAGVCTINPASGQVDCPELTIPSEGSGKRGSTNHAVQVFIEVDFAEVGTGGFSMFTFFGTFSATAGFEVEVDPMGATHTLEVDSSPPGDVLGEGGFMAGIEVIPGDVNGDGGSSSPFSRTYAEGVRVMLKAPATIPEAEQTVPATFAFLNWDLDGTETPANEIVATMDADHSATAQYLSNCFFGNIGLGGSVPVDVYANGTKLLEDLGLGTASPFVPCPIQGGYDVTDANAPDNQFPLLSLSYEAANPASLWIITPDNIFMEPDARIWSANPEEVDFSLFVEPSIYESFNLNLNYRFLDLPSPAVGYQIPEDLDDQNFLSYQSMTPGRLILELHARDTGEQMAAFLLDLTERQGDALSLILRDLDAGKRQNLDLLVFDPEGAPVEAAVVTAVEPPGGVPAAFHLYPGYPNPFNPETTIRYDVPARAHVRLRVVNALGQVVATLVDAPHGPGAYLARFEAGGLPSGLYFLQFEAGPFRRAEPVVLLR